MLLTKEVKIKWNGKTKMHYESKGYAFTEINDVFVAKIEDVQEGASVTVCYQCDNCHAKYDVLYSAYNKRKKDPNYQADLCRSCSKKGKPPVNKLSIAIVRKGFEERGYTLISEEYKGCYEKLLFTCPKHIDKGHLSISWNNLQNGHGCKYCGEERSRKFTAYVCRNVQKIGAHLKYSLEQQIKQSHTILNGMNINGLLELDAIIDEAFVSLKIKKKEIVFDYSKNELEHLEEKVFELFRERTNSRAIL